MDPATKTAHFVGDNDLESIISIDRVKVGKYWASKSTTWKVLEQPKPPTSEKPTKEDILKYIRLCYNSAYRIFF
jgi:hypothetical protein